MKIVTFRVFADYFRKTKIMYSKSDIPEVNAGSMADIAFLLLIFFLVTTTILQEKGLLLKLPPKPEKEIVKEVHDRNLFKILVNSNDQFLIEGKVTSQLTGLQDDLKRFILNYGESPERSDSPQDAVISIKVNRGTSYGRFIEVLDEAKSAYYEIYAERVGITATEFRALDTRDPQQKDLYDQAREGVPMNISIAEPEIAGS